MVQGLYEKLIKNDTTENNFENKSNLKNKKTRINKKNQCSDQIGNNVV